MTWRSSTSLAICALVALSAALLTGDASSGADDARKAPARELLGLPLVYFNDFESGAGPWELATPDAWKLIEQGSNHVFAQFKHVEVKTPTRSPFNRGLVQDLVVADLVLDVRLQSTARDYDHRSLCLFFGFQDPSHFYYVHFGKKTDDHANQIFIVNDADRTKISTETTPGTPWNDDWHHARVVRKVDSGTIEIYFDDMEKPVMKAVDKTFAWGQVGVGSFDDTGNFDDLAVYGRKVARPAKAP